MFNAAGKLWKVKTALSVRANKDTLVFKGQGLGDTKWKGCAWKLLRVRFVINFLDLEVELLNIVVDMCIIEPLNIMVNKHIYYTDKKCVLVHLGMIVTLFFLSITVWFKISRYTFIIIYYGNIYLITKKKPGFFN